MEPMSKRVKNRNGRKPRREFPPVLCVRAADIDPQGCSLQPVPLYSITTLFQVAQTDSKVVRGLAYFAGRAFRLERFAGTTSELLLVE